LLVIEDLKRALLNGGDISSFAGVYDSVLGDPPFQVIERFDEPVALPSHRILARGAPFTSPVKSAAGRSIIDPANVRLVPYSRLDAASIADSVSTLQPDLVALDSTSLDLSAALLYVCSMAYAVSLSVHFDITGPVEKIPFDGLYHPSRASTAVLAACWHGRIPLVSIGRPDSKEERPSRSRYLASRIGDLAAGTDRTGKALRLLVLVEQDSIEGVRSLLFSNTTAEYLPPALEDEFYGSSALGEIIEGPAERLDIRSQIQEEFHAAFAKTIASMRALPVTVEPSILAVEIVNRIRNHPDVIGGPSVRGTLAFEEIIDSFRTIKGCITADSIVQTALLCLPPRTRTRGNLPAEKIVDDVVKEVIFGIRFYANQDYLSEMAPLPDEASPDELAERPTANRNGNKAEKSSFAVVPETRELAGSLANRQIKLDKSDDLEQSYQSLKKAIMSMISELDEQLRNGQISSESYEQRKKSLMKRLESAVKSRLSRSRQETINTIIEMMDAQDKIWDKEISFSRMYIYYHMKDTTEHAPLSPFKKDYHALHWVIDDLQKQDIIRPSGDDSGFLLTGQALDLLLDHLLDKDAINASLVSSHKIHKQLAGFRSNDVRRYSPGDTFRDISIRQTLKEIARKKKGLRDIRYGDLKVFLKERPEPQSDVVFCIDTSGSMGFDRRLTFARLISSGLVQAVLQKGDRAGIVAFNDYGQTTVDLTGKDRNSILNSIAGLSANGNTNISDGIKAARELLLRNRNDNRKAIVLLTDGQASAVSQASFDRLRTAAGQDLTQEAAYQETRKTAEAGIQLSVVYFAPHDEEVEQFIKNIARIGKGKVHRITGFADLKNMLYNRS
jgi:Mg-chelatase subunit ChlD